MTNKYYFKHIKIPGHYARSPSLVKLSQIQNMYSTSEIAKFLVMPDCEGIAIMYENLRDLEQQFSTSRIIETSPCVFSYYDSESLVKQLNDPNSLIIDPFRYEISSDKMIEIETWYKREGLAANTIECNVFKDRTNHVLYATVMFIKFFNKEDFITAKLMML